MKEVSIDKYMTFTPHTVNSSLTIKSARNLMKKYGVRHLPVQTAGKLVGVITDRDLKFAATFDKDGQILVEDIMTPEPFAVPTGTPLGEVAEKMATNLYGCTVVKKKNGQVLGIFTATDGLRAISEALNNKKRTKAKVNGGTK